MRNVRSVEMSDRRCGRVALGWRLGEEGCKRDERRGERRGAAHAHAETFFDLMRLTSGSSSSEDSSAGMIVVVT